MAIVVGLKPAPDYGFSFLKALLGQDDSQCEFLPWISKESVRPKFCGPMIDTVWSNSLLHPFQIWKAVIQRKPHLVHIQHEINMFGGARGVLLLPLLLALLKISRVKMIVTIHAVVPLSDVHGNFPGYFSFPNHPLVSWLMKNALHRIYRWVGQLADKIIVHTHTLSKRLVDEYGLRPNKIHLIPHFELTNGFGEHESKPPPRRFEVLMGKKIILCFGYLVRRKGLENLISAFAEIMTSYPDHVLVIAGGTFQSDYELELKQLVKSLHVEDRVVMTGFLQPAEVFEMYRRSEFVVLSAVHSFSASGPYAVALGMGKPVIAPAMGPFLELISDSLDGLLYDPHDIHSLVRQMGRLIEEHNLRNKISSAMKMKQVELKPDRIAAQTVGLYREVLN